MKFRSFQVVLAILASLAVFWLPAILLPDDFTRYSINASLFILSTMTAFMLMPDVLDILQNHGVGISWQAISAKVGFFLLCANYSAARMWTIIVSQQNFPAFLLHSPMGSFFAYGMGLGMFGIYYGFNSAGEVVPKLTARGALVAALAVGIVIGFALSRLPV